MHASARVFGGDPAQADAVQAGHGVTVEPALLELFVDAARCSAPSGRS